MRVANKTIYDMVKYNLGAISEDLNRANKVISTGKRISDLSDDPVGLTQALGIKSTLSQIDQLGRNIDLGKSWLSASECTLGDVQDIITEAKALCVQMANATNSAWERGASAPIINNLTQEILSLANTQLGGRYIFAGSKTDTAPFSQSYTYDGDNTPFTVKIGRDGTMQVGRDGEAVFGDLFQTMDDLKNDLESNNVDGILDAMEKLEGYLAHISGQISDIGSNMKRMEIKESIFQDLEISNKDRLSQIEDADLAEAILELKSKEVAYQAALSSAAKVMTLSLVDYLQ